VYHNFIGFVYGYLSLMVGGSQVKMLRCWYLG